MDTYTGQNRIGHIIDALCPAHTQEVKTKFARQLQDIENDNLLSNISDLLELVNTIKKKEGKPSQTIFSTNSYLLDLPLSPKKVPTLIAFKSVVWLTHIVHDNRGSMDPSYENVVLYSKYDTNIVLRINLGAGEELLSHILPVLPSTVMIGDTVENKQRYEAIALPYRRQHMSAATDNKISSKSKKLYLFFCFFPYTAMFGVEHFYVGNKKGMLMGILAVVILFASVLVGPSAIAVWVAYGMFMWGNGIYQAVQVKKLKVTDSKGNYLVDKNFMDL